MFLYELKSAVPNIFMLDANKLKLFNMLVVSVLPFTVKEKFVHFGMAVRVCIVRYSVSFSRFLRH
jgi:hypothetical protein